MENIKPMPPNKDFDAKEALIRLEEQFAAHSTFTQQKWTNFEEKFEPMLQEVKDLTEWKSSVQGAWKAVVIISMVIGFIVGAIIQLR